MALGALYPCGYRAVGQISGVGLELRIWRSELHIRADIGLLVRYRAVVWISRYGARSSISVRIYGCGSDIGLGRGLSDMVLGALYPRGYRAMCQISGVGLGLRIWRSGSYIRADIGLCVRYRAWAWIFGYDARSFISVRI